MFRPRTTFAVLGAATLLSALALAGSAAANPATRYPADSLPALRSRAGYVLGSVLQLCIIGYGFWLHAMFVVGVIFTALWVTGLVMGTRAEREAERRWGPVTGTRSSGPSDPGTTAG